MSFTSWKGCVILASILYLFLQILPWADQYTNLRLSTSPVTNHFQSFHTHVLFSCMFLVSISNSTTATAARPPQEVLKEWSVRFGNNLVTTWSFPFYSSFVSENKRKFTSRRNSWDLWTYVKQTSNGLQFKSMLKTNILIQTQSHDQMGPKKTVPLSCWSLTRTTKKAKYIKN